MSKVIKGAAPKPKIDLAYYFLLFLVCLGLVIIIGLLIQAPYFIFR